MPVNFTSVSYKGTSWSWDFGDGSPLSTSENPSHAYASPGKYNVTLTINAGASSLSKIQFIHILPGRGTPYAPASGGNFEVNTDDFGVDHIAGTTWQRGNSAVVGKSSTVSPSNAWVTGLVGNYTDNGETNLMTPVYNFMAAGVYTLRFQSKFITETGFDGYRVEYSLNKGGTWLPVGTTTAANWYNFANSAGTAVFPINEAFFNGSSASYALRSRDVSFLAGNGNVCFRFRFRTDVNTVAAGVAIDDFEILGPVNPPPSPPLPLSLSSFMAYKNNADVMLKWNTENEQNVSKFIVERSNDGLNFSSIGTVNARNQPQGLYIYPDMISLLVPQPTGYLYYRLKMLDLDDNFKYSVVARITLSGAAGITIGPNPFSDHLFVYSKAEVKKITLYDMSGKEMFSSKAIMGNKIMISRPLANGTYIAKIETANGIETRKVNKAD